MLLVVALLYVLVGDGIYLYIEAGEGVPFISSGSSCGRSPCDKSISTNVEVERRSVQALLKVLVAVPTSDAYKNRTEQSEHTALHHMLDRRWKP